jgi:hypothetical protein
MSTDTVHLIGIGRVPAVPLSQDTVRQGAEWVQCDPTDENLAYTLDRCVRPARPGEYPAIREAVLRQRGEDAVV